MKSPQQVQYKVNGKPVPLKGSGKQLEFGYDITSLCVENNNLLQITAYKCCCVSSIILYPLKKGKTNIFYKSNLNLE